MGRRSRISRESVYRYGFSNVSLRSNSKARVCTVLRGMDSSTTFLRTRFIPMHGRQLRVADLKDGCVDRSAQARLQAIVSLWSPNRDRLVTYGVRCDLDPVIEGCDAGGRPQARLVVSHLH